MSHRRNTDRYAREETLASDDGSEKDHESSEEEDVRPSRPPRGGGKNSQKGQQLYCMCKRPYSETEFMICCDGCENWFHGRCVGVTESMAQAIDTYYCPKCQQNRDGEEEDDEEQVVPERAPPPPPKPPAESKPPLRSPISAPATPVELPKASPAVHLQVHSVTPPAPASRHKRKGQAMRAISKLSTLLPPPSLPAPEVLAREAAKFKTEAVPTISASLLDFAKAVSNQKATASSAAQKLVEPKKELLSELRARAADGNLSDSHSSSANPELGNVVQTTATDDPNARRRTSDTAAEAHEEHHKQELNADLSAAAASARLDDQKAAKKRSGGATRQSPKSARRQAAEEAAAASPEVKLTAREPKSNGSTSTLPEPSQPNAAVATTPVVAAAATPLPPPPPPPQSSSPPAVASALPPPPPAAAAPSAATSTAPPPPPPPQAAAAALPSPATEPERKGSARWNKRKNTKKGDEPAAPSAAADAKSIEPESESQSQVAEVEPKRAKPRAKNSTASRDAPPSNDSPAPAALPDDVIAPRRAKLAVYFPQDYNQKTGKPSSQPAAATSIEVGKDDKSSEEEEESTKEKSPKRNKPVKRKGGAAQAPSESSTQNDAEHLAPRRAKLAAYFPEDYKGEKEEGGAGEVEHKADDARLGQEGRTVYCLCKRAYDNRSFMISCTRCEDWFHGSCVGIALQEARRNKNFVCPRCEKRAKLAKQ